MDNGQRTKSGHTLKAVDEIERNIALIVHELSDLKISKAHVQNEIKKLELRRILLEIELYDKKGLLSQKNLAKSIRVCSLSKRRKSEVWVKRFKNRRHDFNTAESNFFDVFGNRRVVAAFEFSNVCDYLPELIAFLKTTGVVYEPKPGILGLVHNLGPNLVIDKPF